MRADATKCGKKDAVRVRNWCVEKSTRGRDPKRWPKKKEETRCVFGRVDSVDGHFYLRNVFPQPAV